MTSFQMKWKTCSIERHGNQQPKKAYTERNSTAESSTRTSTIEEESEEKSSTLPDWDVWIDNN